MSNINKAALVTAFADCGLNLRVMETGQKMPTGRNLRGVFSSGNFRLDILREDRRASNAKEEFVLSIGDAESVVVVNKSPKTRHLLLMVKTNLDQRPGRTPRWTTAQYLCGFDEREYFCADVSRTSPVSVADAIQKLKPTAVVFAEGKMTGVKRQGEWFFIPAPNFDPSGYEIHKKEPIARTGASGRMIGKPHIAEELVRTSGRETEVPTGRLDPNGKPIMRKMTIVNEVYIRGSVRHSDHKTKHFSGWHRVLMNTEGSGGARMTFVD